MALSKEASYDHLQASAAKLVKGFNGAFSATSGPEGLISVELDHVSRYIDQQYSVFHQQRLLDADKKAKAAAKEEKERKAKILKQQLEEARVLAKIREQTRVFLEKQASEAAVAAQKQRDSYIENKKLKFKVKI